MYSAGLSQVYFQSSTSLLPPPRTWISGLSGLLPLPINLPRMSRSFGGLVSVSEELELEEPIELELLLRLRVHFSSRTPRPRSWGREKGISWTESI